MKVDDAIAAIVDGTPVLVEGRIYDIGEAEVGVLFGDPARSVRVLLAAVHAGDVLSAARENEALRGRAEAAERALLTLSGAARVATKAEPFCEDWNAVCEAVDDAERVLDEVVALGRALATAPPSTPSPTE